MTSPSAMTLFDHTKLDLGCGVEKVTTESLAPKYQHRCLKCRVIYHLQLRLGIVFSSATGLARQYSKLKISQITTACSAAAAATVALPWTPAAIGMLSLLRFRIWCYVQRCCDLFDQLGCLVDAWMMCPGFHRVRVPRSMPQSGD